MGRPFRQLILKTHARCDLACDHCYVYTMRDQRWSQRPRVMSSSVLRAVALRLEEHVRAHSLSSVEVVFHGGEPLLAGVDHLVEAVRVLSAAGPVRFALQTNGVLLTSAVVDVLADLGVRVGVSLDGDRSAHDRHRRRADGSGSYDAVVAGVRLLVGRPVFAGLLCTVDLRNDPVRCYEALLPFSPPAVDFLLPNANWSSPPPPGSYADWLCAAFDRWYLGGETQVRMFAEIINVLLGGQSSVEGFGTSAPASVVIETDGSLEVSDMLSSAFEGAAATGLNVRTSSFDDALLVPGVVAHQSDALCASCDACDLRKVCGGGVYAHRYRAGSFLNPSVYCADLYALISHVRERVSRDVAQLAVR
ncbi:FxsB family cyclophane-forming radical SAM/SPASM peptide maturase [Lentzea sp. JNUCC 0626]|uniref:FxsB family cyclophane-forming radical SAM/SPASM peptide maturase n=1 Tax=Lentzea sp. JNUCC 0626 TaxID=3367513 RepID=UPI003747EBD9